MVERDSEKGNTIAHSQRGHYLKLNVKYYQPPIQKRSHLLPFTQRVAGTIDNMRCIIRTDTARTLCTLRNTKETNCIHYPLISKKKQLDIEQEIVTVTTQVPFKK